MVRVNTPKALPKWFGKITLLRVGVHCTGPPLMNDGQSLVGSPLPNGGQVDPADVHVCCVVARPRTVKGFAYRRITGFTP